MERNFQANVNVETPELARCPSNDQQLMYGDIQNENIDKFSTTPAVMKGVEVKDHWRFFKGKYLRSN